MAGFSLLRNFIAAHSRPGAALWILVVGIGVNGVADWALMFGEFGFPRLELLGLGIATSSVQCLLFLALLAVVLLDRRWRRSHPTARFWRPAWPRLRQVWGSGLWSSLPHAAPTGLVAAPGSLRGQLARVH